MAHTCPDCGCLCHCGGDIDDIDFGDDDKCTHYMEPECPAFDDYAGDDPEDWNPPPGSSSISGGGRE